MFLSGSITDAPARRRLAGVAGATLTASVLVVSLASPAQAAPPNIPSKTKAKTELSSLTVSTEGSMTGYDRDRFPHWHAVSGNCNTREMVLKRDGKNVKVGNDCAPTAGSWYSPYDGATWTKTSDIDHIVPLAEAWRSGASKWTDSKREDFANDLSGTQLIAVTDNVNQSKGDKDPASWQPPRAAYTCTYAKMWIHSKYEWKLTLQSAEKTALQDMLATC